MIDDMEKDVFELAEEEDERAVAKAKGGRKKKSAKLEEEYDSSFDGEEKMMHKLANIKSEVKTFEKEINIEDIAATPFKKVGRTDSISGLRGVVSEWGVFTPIHVLALEDEDCYQLLDGLRRIFAAQRVGKKTIKAIIWDFSDKREGKELANILSLMINRTQKYTPKEMWEQMKTLEAVNDATPGLIEYLLQMNAGDAMKLKDVMLADNSYSDFRDNLLNGKYTIEQAYKKLCNERKKEDKLEKEDRMSVDADGLYEHGSRSYNEDSPDGEEERLSVNEVKEILELNPVDEEKDVDDYSIEDLNRTDEIRKDSLHQKVGERTFVDQSVKKATLIRDNNRCRCCGIGGAQWAGILVYHHVVPVYAGGPDTVENGLTLCVNCHLTLHNYITGDVQIPEDLNEREEKIFKNIMNYGNIAIDASNKLGMKRDELRKANVNSKRHPMPSLNVKINKEALRESEELESKGGTFEDLTPEDLEEDVESANVDSMESFDSEKNLEED